MTHSAARPAHDARGKLPQLLVTVEVLTQLWCSGNCFFLDLDVLLNDWRRRGFGSASRFLLWGFLFLLRQGFGDSFNFSATSGIVHHGLQHAHDLGLAFGGVK